MRLVCPNCDAEYEVDGALIPPEGRDVQCSNCSNTWLQQPPDADVSGTVPAGVAGLTPRRPHTDPAALDIIHEEVERETQARVSDGTNLETQGELGLDQAETRAGIGRDRGVPLHDDDMLTISEIDEAALAPAPRREEGTKRELFPDIEEINSTLASPPPTTDAETGADAPSRAPRRNRSGFRTGFGLMLLLTALGLGVYLYAPALAERFPGATDMLARYVGSIDGYRIWLDGAAESLLAKVTAMTEDIGN